MSDRDAHDVEPPLPAAVLAALPAAMPPRSFARRAVRAAVGGHPRVSSMLRWAAVAAGLVAAALPMLPSRFRSHGHARATQRQTLVLHDRATAVVEGGGELQWSADGNDVRVQQTAGAAFYRVARGGSFTIETPHGTIAASGTSFNVEVQAMSDEKRPGVLAAAGVIATSAALVIAVYEGRVEVETAAGGVEAEGGEIVRLEGSRLAVADRGAPRTAPVTVTDAVADSGDLTRLQGEALALRRRINGLETELAALDQPSRGHEPPVRTAETEQERAVRCVTRGGPDCSFAEPEPAELELLAERCNVRTDMPAVLDANASLEPSPEWIERAGLSAEEVGVFVEANRDYLARYDARLQQAYLELGGSPELAEGLSRGVIEGMIFDLVPDEVAINTIAAVARERAGWTPPPDHVPEPAARVMRALLDLGSDYEAFLAERLDAELARDLRRMDDGWPDKSTYGRGFCPGEAEED